MSNEVTMPFTKHLEELRQRLIKCCIAVAIGFVASYFFKEQLLEWLMMPMLQSLPEGPSQKLVYTAPHEAFMTYLKVSLIAGAGLATPVLIFQLWRFIAPGLYTTEKKYILPVVFFSTVFFVGGALFGYFCVFPTAFSFFTSFASDFIAPMISTKEYLSFAIRMLLGFGFVFELPIFVFFLARMGLITSRFLRRQRKYAVLLIFIVAAFLTPSPDIFSQLMMAVPLLILYELSIWIAHFFARKSPIEDYGTAEEETTHSAA